MERLWLPHLDPANAWVPEWTHLLCLDRPIENPGNSHGQARYYLGTTDDLAAVQEALHGSD